jgi:pimeloyl-ACP methyl ester carboxylesterase
MNKKIPSLIIMFLFIGIGLFAQEDKDEFPTFNEEMAIGIEEDSIAVYALIASGNNVKETVILLHGIPGNEKNLDLAQDLRREGKNVIFFSYRGAWGSQGTYSYSNCLEDIGHILDYFSDSVMALKMRIDTSRFTLIGHSLGGGLALIKGAKDSRVKKIIALSAANFGYEWKEVTSVDSLQGFQNYIRSSFVLNCNAKEFVQEIIDDKTEYNVLTFTQELETKKVLIIDDYDRSNKWPGQLLKPIEYKIIESDHSFTNKRKELSVYIIAWLTKN